MNDRSWVPHKRRVPDTGRGQDNLYRSKSEASIQSFMTCIWMCSVEVYDFCHMLLSPASLFTTLYVLPAILLSICSHLLSLVALSNILPSIMSCNGNCCLKMRSAHLCLHFWTPGRACPEDVATCMSSHHTDPSKACLFAIARLKLAERRSSRSFLARFASRGLPDSAFCRHCAL